MALCVAGAAVPKKEAGKRGERERSPVCPLRSLVQSSARARVRSPLFCASRPGSGFLFASEGEGNFWGARDYSRNGPQAATEKREKWGGGGVDESRGLIGDHFLVVRISRCGHVLFGVFCALSGALQLWMMVQVALC